MENPMKGDQDRTFGLELPYEPVSASSKFARILKPLNHIHLLNPRALRGTSTTHCLVRSCRLPRRQLLKQRAYPFLHSIIHGQRLHNLTPIQGGPILSATCVGREENRQERYKKSPKLLLAQNFEEQIQLPRLKRKFLRQGQQSLLFPRHSQMHDNAVTPHFHRLLLCRLHGYNHLQLLQRIDKPMARYPQHLLRRGFVLRPEYRRVRIPILVEQSLNPIPKAF